MGDIDRFVTTIWRDPQTRKMAIGTAAGLVMFGIGMYLLSSSMLGEDKDGIKIAKKINSNAVINNIILPMTDSAGNPISVPSPFQWRLFTGIGHLIGRQLTGDAREGEAVSESLNAVKGAFSPFQDRMIDTNKSLEENIAMSLGAILPTMVKPLYQVARNRDAFNNPIASTYAGVGEKAFAGYAKTPDIFKRSAKFLNEKGMDIAPETLQHLIYGYTGTVGRSIQKLNKEDTGEDTGFANIPVASRFIARTDYYASDIFREAQDKFNSISVLEDRIKAGDQDAKVKYSKIDLGTRRQYAKFKKVKNATTRLQKIKSKLAKRNSKDMRIAKIETKIKQLKTQFAKGYN